MPADAAYDEMICAGCMRQNDFLWNYAKKYTGTLILIGLIVLTIIITIIIIILKLIYIIVWYNIHDNIFYSDRWF